jgi:hypothetical protein
VDEARNSINHLRSRNSILSHGAASDSNVPVRQKQSVSH